MKPEYTFRLRIEPDRIREHLGRIELPRRKTKQSVKKVVDACKDRLKRERDPEKRHRLAIIGQEFNLLYMQL